MEVITQTLCPMGYDKAVFLSLKARENLKSSLHQLLATASLTHNCFSFKPSNGKAKPFPSHHTVMFSSALALTFKDLMLVLGPPG